MGQGSWFVCNKKLEHDLCSSMHVLSFEGLYCALNPSSCMSFDNMLLAPEANTGESYLIHSHRQFL